MMYRTTNAVCVCIDTGFVGFGKSISGKMHCKQYMAFIFIKLKLQGTNTLTFEKSQQKTKFVVVPFSRAN